MKNNKHKRTSTRLIAMLLSFIIIITLPGCELEPSNELEAGNDQEVAETSHPDDQSVVPADNVEDLPNATHEESTDIAGEELTLDEVQKNSIAMLNYLAVLSREINESKNSRLFLEEAYDSLINNTNPDKVNELTESHMSSLLDIIERYRMISVKRDRLQYIYDQNKAKALKESMPNPVALLSAVSSFDIKKLAASVAYMAVDSYSSYKSYNAEIDLQYMKDGWELDDEEAANLHDSRKRAFTFMIEIVREDNLPGELALNETSVKNFVECQNKTNNFEKTQFLESEKETYEAFGLYWLELANCYYEGGDYGKCLSAIRTYENLQADIFRKDYYFAQAIPNAIVAASEVYDEKQYIAEAERLLQLLCENTERDEWALRCFAAQTYIDLFNRTNNTNFLKKAYDLTLNNVTELIGEQRKQNETYLSEVQEVALPHPDVKSLKGEEKKTAKEENASAKEYNKALHKQRKTELAPVYEPLVLNLDILFAIADKLEISDSEKVKIDGILRGDDHIAFLSEQLENKYSFSPKKIGIEASFEKDTLTLPAACLSVNSTIVVSVTEAGKTTKYTDWTIKKVDRPTTDFDSFTATFESKKISDQAWSEKSVVEIEIIENSGSDNVSQNVVFNVCKYIHLPIISDIVQFEQVS